MHYTVNFILSGSNFSLTLCSTEFSLLTAQFKQHNITTAFILISIFVIQQKQSSNKHSILYDFERDYKGA